MRVDAITRTPFVPQTYGATAELAQARKTITAIHPHVSWATVLDEARRVQREQGMTMVSALQVVFARLNSGAWQPHVGATRTL